MDVQIQPYESRHRIALCEIWFDSFLSSGLTHGDDTTVATLLARWDQETAARWTALVAVDGEDLLGFAAFAPETCHLHQLFVARSAQGRGTGKLLLDAVKRRFPDGFTLNTHVENAGARRFYEREGMVHQDTRPHARYGHMTAVYRWR